MNRIRMTALGCLFMLSLLAAQPNQHPMDMAGGMDNTWSHSYAVSDVGLLYYNLKGFKIDIYEAANIKLSRASQKKYFYEPRYRIRYANGRPMIRLNYSAARPTVFVEIEPMLPEREDIVQYIYYNCNHHVQSYNVQPLGLLGYEITYPGATVFRKDCAAGVAMDQPISATLEFPRGGAQEAYRELLTGQSLHLSYAIRMHLSQLYELAINEKAISESQVYRDFISPVLGRTIFAMQANIATTAIQREITVNVILEGGNETMKILFDDLWNRMFNAMEQDTILFENLARGSNAEQILIDFGHDKRYATDYIKKLAMNAKNMTQYEWDRQVVRQLQTELEKSHKKESGGGGGFNIGSIFGISGNGSSKSEQYLYDALLSLFTNSDKGKQFFENSFSYEQEGEVWIPKGIIAHELGNREFIEAKKLGATFYQYSQRILRKSYDVSLSHDYE